MSVPKWGEPGRQEWERRRYRDALYRILDELGVPGSGYPAPAVNAVAIAKEALAVTPTGPALTVPPHTWQYLNTHVADLSIICTVCKKHGPADDRHWILRMNTEGCVGAGTMPSRPIRRLRRCVEGWPDCTPDGYDPRCCRFPKSCSCTVYDEALISESELESRTDKGEALESAATGVVRGGPGNGTVVPAPLSALPDNTKNPKWRARKALKESGLDLWNWEPEYLDEIIDIVVREYQ